MQQAIEISEDAFAAIFRPKRNHLDEHASYDWGDGFGTLYETFGEELAYVQSQDAFCIWTLIECDGSQFVISGFQMVNRLGYFVTEQLVPDGVDIEVPLEDDLPLPTASQDRSAQLSGRRRAALRGLRRCRKTASHLAALCRVAAVDRKRSC